MKFNLKRALSLNSVTSGKGSNWLFIIGALALGGLGVMYLTGQTAKANFANSLNSINRYGDGDFGNSQNSFYPIRSGSPTDTYIHPVSYPPGRRFPDYTNRTNSIPSPFVEINFPRDAIGRGAKLANTIDKCAEVFSYQGSNWNPVR